MKLLILLVVVLAAIVWFKRRKAILTALLAQMGQQQAQEQKAQAQAVQQEVGAVETMVQCKHCGVYFPVSEAVSNLAGDVFCCVEHQRQSS